MPVREHPLSVATVAGGFRQEGRLPLSSERVVGKVVSITFLVLLATLGLQWIIVRSIPGGSVKYYHLAAVVFTFVYLFLRRSRGEVTLVLQEYALFYWCFSLFLALELLANAVHRDAYAGIGEVVRQASYGLVSVFVAALFVRIQSRSFQRVLVWACPFSTVVVLTLLTAPLVRQGVNPLGVLANAVSSGDPAVVLRDFFRAAFRSAGLDAAAPNLRHGVIGALLLSLLLTLLVWRRSRWPRSTNVVVLCSATVCLSFILVSLSRSVILSFAISLGIYVALPLLRGRVTARHLTGAVTILLVGIALAVLPQGKLLRGHFSGNTGSYTQRYDASARALERFGESALLGSERLDEYGAVVESPHDVVLNALLAGGVVAALAAGAFLVIALSKWLRVAKNYVGGRTEYWALDVRQFCVLSIGSYPIARFLTAGSGSLQLVEWVALGAFFGILMANEQERRGRRAELVAVGEEGPTPTQVRSRSMGSSQPRRLDGGGRTRGSGPG